MPQFALLCGKKSTRSIFFMTGILYSLPGDLVCGNSSRFEHFLDSFTFAGEMFKCKPQFSSKPLLTLIFPKAQNLIYLRSHPRPFPVNPGLHLQLYDPSVLLQKELRLQLCEPSAHSSMSKKRVKQTKTETSKPTAAVVYLTVSHPLPTNVGYQRNFSFLICMT